MKWLTDHICVRGVNFLIPHAFSPRFPDADCPPHFYAQGHNPQWRYFHHWSSYANRICYLLSQGQHSAPAAVVYHAEAEWAGDAQPFEDVSRNRIVPIRKYCRALHCTPHQRGALWDNGKSTACLSR